VEPKELFARNLRAARGRIGISQEALAARAELHRTAVSLLERGGRDPQLLTMVRLARALDVELSVLVKGIR
jgi:transcriptional regulator with XRE-family HTH domain